MKTNLYTLVFSCIIAFNAAIAQEQNQFSLKDNPWGVNLELGVTSFGGIAGISGFYQIGNVMIQPQYQYSENHQGNPNRFIETFALLIGYSSRKKLDVSHSQKVTPVFSLLTGLGAMTYTVHGEVVNNNHGFLFDLEDDYKTYKRETICWKIECEILLSNDHFAIGFIPFVNLSTYQPISGLKFRWQLGQLRTGRNQAHLIVP